MLTIHVTDIYGNESHDRRVYGVKLIGHVLRGSSELAIFCSLRPLLIM